MAVNDKMYIPKTLKVGYQNRQGTYTGKLAYVIYFDEKGKLRKEKSWEQWRDKKLDPQEIPNDPIEGFVLNKDVGGVGSRWHWNDRMEKVRVYDPRDFEFEISIPNLLFILQETSAIKGKGLEGEFVYAWSGTELVLLPVESEIYKACNVHTERQAVKMKKEDMKEGYSYIMKDGEPVMYLGRHPYNNKDRNWRSNFTPVGKMHIFLRLTPQDERKYGQRDPYIAESGFTRVAECTSPSSLDTYPDELDKFKSSIWYGEFKEVKVTKVTFRTDLREKTLLIKEDDKYYPFAFRELYDYIYYGDRKKKFEIKKGTKPFTPKLKDGTIKVPSISISYRRSHYDESKPEHLTEDQMKNLNLYKIQVVTATDKTITVG